MKYIKCVQIWGQVLRTWTIEIGLGPSQNLNKGGGKRHFCGIVGCARQLTYIHFGVASSTHDIHA